MTETNPTAVPPPATDSWAAIEAAVLLVIANDLVDEDVSRAAVELVSIAERIKRLAGAVPDTGQVCTECTSRGAPVCCCERPADLAYARSEVDKWLDDGDPYCILPTRTEHIPALLARLDELEGTR